MSYDMPNVNSQENAKITKEKEQKLRIKGVHEKANLDKAKLVENIKKKCQIVRDANYYNAVEENKHIINELQENMEMIWEKYDETTNFKINRIIGLKSQTQRSFIFKNYGQNLEKRKFDKTSDDFVKFFGAATHRLHKSVGDDKRMPGT